MVPGVVRFVTVLAVVAGEIERLVQPGIGVSTSVNPDGPASNPAGAVNPVVGSSTAW
jgi:hypothetical protein